MFTRQHYEAIATIIANKYADYDKQQSIQEIACDLADYFEQDNVNFSKKKFLKAYGVE